MASGTASRGRRALFYAEEAAARVLCGESSEDDLDDLFTLEDLQEDNSEEDCFSGGDDVSDSLEKESFVVLSGGMQSDRSATSSPPPKRSRMDNRLVCRIDEALDPENFEEMELPTTKKTYTGYLGPKKQLSLLLGPDGQVATAQQSSRQKEPPPSEASTGRRRCFACVEELVGAAGYKAKKDKLPKVKMACGKCQKAVGPKHSLHLCGDCT